jgi:hypothetical protein
MFHYNNQTDQGDETEGLEREGLQGEGHRVYRVPGFLSSRPNWVPPPPLPLGSVAPSPFGSEGETHSLAGEGVGRSVV